MAQLDLVTLSNMKAWLGIDTEDPVRDQMLKNMITQMSRAICNSLNRQTLIPSTVTEYYSGNGKNRLLLKNWPVHSIVSLKIDGIAVSIATSSTSNGIFLEPAEEQPPGNMQMVYYRGGVFPKGDLNIEVTYMCGYKTAELVTITTNTATASNSYGQWQTDESVQFTFGNLLTKVATSPAPGQYSVTTEGVYTFNAADNNKAVILEYGFIPADLTQCIMEWMSYRYSAKDRPGMTSKSLGGQETVSFTNEAIPAFVADSLRNFRRIVPC